MGIFDELFASGTMLGDQVSREIFDIIPKDGFQMAIMDRSGSVWASDEGLFEKASMSKTDIRLIAARIDDGAETVMTQKGSFTVVASDIVVRNRVVGYSLIAIEDQLPEQVLLNIDIYEFALRQVSLLASSFSKSNTVHHEYLKKAQMETLNTSI